MYESWNGVSGFQWLALGGLGLLALRGRRALTALVALGLAWFLIQFQLMAYLRYLTPPLVLLLPALAIAASERARPLGAVLAVLAVAGNLAMQANANWVLRDFGVADILRAKGETEQLVARVAPELPLIERARARTARPRILLADPERPFAAACGGCAFVRNWYDHELKARLAGDEPDALRRALQPLGFSHVILHRGSASASAFEPALEALGAVPIAHLNGAELWELPPAPPTATDLFEQRDLARQHFHRPRPPSSTGNP
ncbi:MAG: hypothetical protein KatS3mg126_1706 [Lysobacteraceae bacterium]|nr:MAG: hypothetical protein KatS3mg126_1706 [Xanthomonadaceae bacterium]